MFGRHVARTVRPFVKCHLQELSKMQGAAAGQPGDLLPATEPVGNDQRGGVGISDGRQQNALAHRDRHVIVSGLEAERTRHAATAGIENLEIEPEPPQQVVLIPEAHDVIMMAVLLHQGLAAEPGRTEMGRPPLQELAE